MMLPEAHPLAPAWAKLIDFAGSDVRPGAHPWQLYEFAPAPNQLRGLPTITGPMIYAVPEGATWFYVGQTRKLLATRLGQHLSDPYRASLWPAVMAIQLHADVTAMRLDELEHAGRDILKPVMGSRWASAPALH